MKDLKQSTKASGRSKDSAEDAVKRALIEKIEYFYIDIVEEFREAEQRIINDSQFRSLFKKKDYDGNIALLKECRKRTLNIDHLDLKEWDSETKEVAEAFRKACTAFLAVCDSYVQLQVFLKKKSQKEEARFSVYKEIFNKVNESKDAANSALHALDIVYTDYTENLELYGDEEE